MSKTNTEKKHGLGRSLRAAASLRESPYSEPLLNFESALFLLEELNKQIPKSIREMADKQEIDLRKRVKELDGKSKAELRKIVQLIGDLKSEKPRMHMDMPISDEAAEILIQSVKTFVFQNRFSTFITDMSLVYLIAEFESFLQNILRISFREKPEILASCQKSITFEALVKLRNINDAKQQIMEKEILSITSQDIEDISKYIEQKFNIKIYQFVNWKEFKERFCRRNILIHNLGMTNRLYRLKTGYKGKDKRLTISENYLNGSIKLFEKMAFEIGKHFHSKFK